MMRDHQQENFQSKKKEKETQNLDTSQNDMKAMLNFKQSIEQNDIEELTRILQDDKITIKGQTLSNGLNIALEQYRSNGTTIEIIDLLLE
jgi:hypothetical protein